MNCFAGWIVRNGRKSMQDAARVVDRSKRSFNVSAAVRRFTQQSLTASRGIGDGQRRIPAKFRNRSLLFVLNRIAQRANKGNFRSERFGDVKGQTMAFPGWKQRVPANERHHAAND